MKRLVITTISLFCNHNIVKINNLFKFLFKFLLFFACLFVSLYNTFLLHFRTTYTCMYQKIIKNLRELTNRDQESIIPGEIKTYNVMFMVTEDLPTHLLL